MTQIVATDLWFPSQQDPVGRDHGGNFRNYNHTLIADDPVRYIVWVDAGRLSSGRYGFRPELAPRTALHLVRCRNGTEVTTATT